MVGGAELLVLGDGFDVERVACVELLEVLVATVEALLGRVLQVVVVQQGRVVGGNFHFDVFGVFFFYFLHKLEVDDVDVACLLYQLLMEERQNG